MIGNGGFRASRFLLAGLFGLLSGTAWAADDVIKIGAVLPVTGKESKIGGAYKQATELAVKEVNDAGGVKVGGKAMKIELTLLDDTSDAAKSAQLVEQLITQQKVHAIVGGYGSHLVQAQSVVPERYGAYISGGGGRASTAAVSGSSGALPGGCPVANADGFLSARRAGKLKPLKIALLIEHGTWKDYAWESTTS
jgi:branched-chain amino acid transport system substrate-binding protein